MTFIRDVVTAVRSICEKSQSVVEPSNNAEVMDTVANTSNKSRGGKLVLLQTARALAANESTGRSANVHILFDTGSQRSYVTDSLTNRLKLKPLGKERLHLNTFGDHSFRTKTCDVV